MRGALPPLTSTPSWDGAQLKHRDSSTLHLLFFTHSLPYWLWWLTDLGGSVIAVSVYK
jgi:hypothetical protein